MSTLLNRNLASFLSFNLGWWACALGPTYQMPWLGPALVPFWVGLHLYMSPTKLGEFLFILFMSATGFLVDSLFLHVQLFQFEGGLWAPLWLVSIWALLALSFESMLVMRQSPWLTALNGVLCGPVSYFFIDALGQITYAQPFWLSLSLHGLFWIGLMPYLFWARESFLRFAINLHSPGAPRAP